MSSIAVGVDEVATSGARISTTRRPIEVGSEASGSGGGPLYFGPLY